jgi:PAS domain S-box-containing protein
MATKPAPADAVAGHQERAESDSAAVERLRTMLERQPSCLMRIDTDGTLLAVSDAALTLLGASKLEQVLDTNLVEHIKGDSPAAAWSDFTARVVSGGSASAECEIDDVAGTRRSVILLGVALPDHPDGRTSLLVTVRDVSTARGLEASLHEQEDLRRSVQAALDTATAQLAQLGSQLQQVTSERHELRAALDTILRQRQQIASSVEQLRSALTTAMDAAASAKQVVDKDLPK